LLLDALLLAVGIALLTGGGELFIRGALAAARRLGVSPLLSGLVIVGFGTSAPELVVSVSAALDQQPDIAIGNVVGSNIGNIMLILGICALITPLAVSRLALQRDAATVVAVSILFLLLVAGSALVRLDAVVLLAGLAGYIIWAYATERLATTPAAERHRAEGEAISVVPDSLARTLAALAGGLVLLIGGSQVLLAGATGIAVAMGVPETVIGLTLVAVGTSVPELSVSVIAALRRQADVAIGNILGSNIFNLLGILGLSALLQPLPVATRILQFDQWIMLATAVLLLGFLYTGRRLSRLEGGVLLAGYVLYLIVGFALFSAPSG